MPDLKPQSLKNHARFDPWYHAIPVVFLLFLLIAAIINLVQNIHGSLLMPIFFVVLPLLLLNILLKVRIYPLKVQDRVIRLEEQLRMAMLLPEALKKRIPELSEDQLIGLRFASDAELPTLVELALDKHLTRKEIKERIQSWRPDNWRI
jgi:hypothetical protein